MEFFETAARNIRAAETAAGVEHHAALSVVGTDRLLASGYFRAKMAQEKLIEASPIPYTILRSTQFFEFINSIAASGTVGQTVRLPSALCQPIASDDVAEALVDVAPGAPVNGMVEVAGPEAVPLDELIRPFLRANRDERQVITDVHASYFGLQLTDRSYTRRWPAHWPHPLRDLAPPLHYARALESIIGRRPYGLCQCAPPAIRHRVPYARAVAGHRSQRSPRPTGIPRDDGDALGDPLCPVRPWQAQDVYRAVAPGTGGHQRRSPSERAAYVLREACDYPLEGLFASVIMDGQRLTVSTRSCGSCGRVS